MNIENNVVEIIDLTLIELWKSKKDQFKNNIEKVREIMKLIFNIGADYIAVTPEIYKEVYPVPKNVEFKFMQDNIIDIKTCKNINEEIKKYKTHNNENNIQITGLDDLIFYEYKTEFYKILNTFGNKIEMAIRNKFCSATAMTLEWINIGGEKVVTTFSGIGEYAALEEVLCGIKFIEKRNVRGDCKLLPRLLELFEQITETKVSTTKPFIGKDIFNVESGIHVNGIYKNPKTFEPYNPKEIGRSRKIIIGKHSGAKALEIKLKELNINYDYGKLNKVLEAVRIKSIENRRGLYNEELVEIYNKVGN